MRTASHARSRQAFSLIELMCVITIIMILVGMMLGPINRAYKRAKNLEGELQSTSFPSHIHEALVNFYEDQTVYPALTPDQLGTLGVFDGNILAYLQKPGVQYFPFSSADPGSKVILLINQGKKARAILYKHQVAKDP